MNRTMIIGSFIFLNACSSLSLFKETDCRTSSKQYGSCFADLGYTEQGFNQLQKYCQGLGIELDSESFHKSRLTRQNEICATADGVFTQSFRTAIGINGPETCPQNLIASDPLKKAAEDGRAAAYNYKRFNEEASAARHAIKRREAADRNGFWSGFWDRLFYSPDNLQSKSEKAAAEYRTVRASYPDADKPSLTERLKCNPDGWL